MSTSVTVKTLQGKLLKVPVEPSDTIAHLKAKLESITGDPVSCQKLFSAGKTMTDDCVVEQCGFKEKDFLVLMVSKAPGSISLAPVSSSARTSTFPTSTYASISEVSTPAFNLDPAISTPSSTDLAPAVSVPTSPEPASQSSTRFTAIPASTTPASEQSSTGPSLVGMQTAFAVGPPSKNAISRLKDMGFSEDNIRPALRAAYNSPDRAAEVMMSGQIPEDPEPQSPAEGLEQAMASIQIPPRESTESSPSLAEEFEKDPDSLMQIFEAFSGGEGGGNTASFGRTGTNTGTRTIAIGLTGEEIASLDRLLEMGFGRNKTIEAFMYCDKNEELAINYLLEYGDDDN
ncbi:UV excision repair protein RAD23 A [Tulasnella sp. 417]|nr:UV excision repair protein RAD23 A [Tulasnella sp. 417]